MKENSISLHQSISFHQSHLYKKLLWDKVSISEDLPARLDICLKTLHMQVSLMIVHCSPITHGNTRFLVSSTLSTCALTRLLALQHQMVGGENADNEQVKEEHERKMKLALTTREELDSKDCNI